MLASASVAAASSAVSSSSFSASQAPRGMYVAHAQQPTVITQSLTCNLTSGSTTNLVLARCSRLDVMAVTPQGLQLLKELPIHGRVASLAAYLPPRSSQHRLLVLTEAHALFALSADAQSQQFSTAASVDLTHRVGQPSDHGPTVLVTPQANLIAVHAYEGVLSCIPVDAKGALGDVVDVRVEETRVLDLCFLLGHSRPVLCVLCSDYKDKRHVRSFVLDVREREAKPGPLTLPALDHCPVRIAPVDDGGVLVVGEEAAVLYSRDGRALCHVLLTPCTITSVCRIDATRFLVADLHGDLSMLIIQTQAQPPASSSSSSSSSSSAVRLHRELLGHTTIASTMSYLGDSAVFVGSTLGDHALLRLLTERGEDGGFVQVVDSFPNLGSIVDMAVMEVDGGQGQAQLVTCSGAFQCGTLRVVRNGVGVEEEASIELPGIQGMWAVRATDDSADDRLLLQSFVGETRVLVMEDDELGEIEMEGLDAALPTLWAGNVLGQHMVQVTERSVRVISISSSALVTEWKEGRITMASGNRRQVLLAQGRELVLLRWDGRRLVEERRVALEHEVACLDVTPIDDGGEARFAALGLWTDLTLRVLALPSLAEVSREAVGGEVIPRSVLLCPFSPSSVFLLAGLGDGQLLSLSLSTSSGALSGRKRLTLGSQPIALSPFRTGGRLHVFAACDRPTVVYCAQERLLYSTVNLKDVHHMASFSTSTFPASLAFASSTHLVIGPIDSIQKLHIQTVPLAAQPRKVAWFKDEHCLLVLVSRFVRDDSRRDTQGVQWRELSELLALDDEGFEVRSRVELARSEVGSALFVTREPLNGDAFVVVGATVMVADEPMPKRGRLLLLRVEGRQQLRLVSSTATKGAVTCIDQVLGRIAVGINSKVVVYRATREGGDTRLIAECSHVGKCCTVALATFEQYIVVGDLLQSVAFLVYAPAGTTGSVPTIELVARDWDSASITALAPLWTPTQLPGIAAAVGSSAALLSSSSSSAAAPFLFLAGDALHNLFAFHRSPSASEEERTRVELAGKFHLGDFVNVIRAGSLVMTAAQHADGADGWRVSGSHLLATLGGGIAVVALLGRDEFVWLSRLEEALEKSIGALGRLEHRAWRAWKGERGRKDAAAVAFIDGDLIEMAVELRAEQQQQVSVQMGEAWPDILRRVEEVSRIH